MARFLHHNFPFLRRKYGSIFLALFWAAGLGAGVIYFLAADESVTSLMRMALSEPVSIVGLLASVYLPFLFSVFTVFVFSPWFLLPLCFGKAFCFAYASCGLFSSFGSAGWLIWLLAMFRDIGCVILLYLYWQRHIDRRKSFSPTATALYLFSAGLVVGLDFWYVAPFLEQLLLF